MKFYGPYFSLMFVCLSGNASYLIPASGTGKGCYIIAIGGSTVVKQPCNPNRSDLPPYKIPTHATCHVCRMSCPYLNQTITVKSFIYQHIFTIKFVNHTVQVSHLATWAKQSFNTLGAKW